jgi:uncharacterized RDD family membrane protein YckC
MSHAGPPPGPPDPNQPDPSQPPQDGQQWSPYPSGWDPQAQPGQAPPGQAQSGQPSPYAQPAPYGQPAAYPQNPYGAAPYDAAVPGNVYAGTPRPDRPLFGFGGYASWSSRVGAFLIDQTANSVAGLPLWIGYAILLANTTTTTDVNGNQTSSYDGSLGLPLALVAIGALTSLAFFTWNICIRQGRTGASIGKSVLAIRLVNVEQQPIGGGWCFLRYLLHIVDALPCYLGYLWPLWDQRKQTFSDKIMSTYVIHATEPQPGPY